MSTNSTVTQPSVTINNVVYTAKRFNQFPTITFANTAVAGSEVVSVDSNHNITVGIQSGVSTNLQVKTAIDASTSTSGLAASDLVSVNIASYGAGVIKSCVSAPLAGGITTAVKASALIGDLLFTAKTAGVGGNSIRVKYTTGTLLVSASSSDITIRIPLPTTSADQFGSTTESGPTSAQIIAAIVADSPCNALVAVTTSKSPNKIQRLASAPAFVSLTGGLSVAVASVVVQDLTFASDSSATGTADNGRTMSYTDGATAGAEVVSGTTNINVQIQSGTSTATNVKAALDASSSFNGVASTGTFTVSAYAPLHLTKASGTITYGSPTAKAAATKAVTYGSPDYLKVATPSGNITFGAPADNSTVVLTGLPTDGTKTFTKKTAVTEVKATGSITYGIPVNGDTVIVNGTTFTKAAAGSATEFSSISELEALVEAVAGLNSSEDGTTISITSTLVGVLGNAQTLAVGGGNTGTMAVSGAFLTGGADAYVLGAGEFETIANLSGLIGALTDVDSSYDATYVYISVITAGTAMNSATVTGTSSYSALSITFSGGITTPSTITVNSNTFTCVASAPGATEFSSISELTALIQALTNVNASDDSSIITIVAAVKGAAGNSIAISKTGAGLTFTGSTLAGGADGSTVTVNSVTSTCIDAAPGANEFTSISELTALVTAITGIDATDNGSVVAVVAATAGTAGNSLAMSKTGAGLTLSGSVLSGGYNAATVAVNGITLTESNQWTASSSNNSTAASLASAITTATATTLSTAVAVSTNVVTITANAVNASGDGILLATSDVTNLAKSGAHLTGGVNGLACTISGTGGTAQVTVNGVAMTGAVGPQGLGFYVSSATTALTSSFVYFSFLNIMQDLELNNDETTGNKQVIFSFDGINNHGILAATESRHILKANKGGIYLKYGNAAPAYRVSAV